MGYENDFVSEEPVKVIVEGRTFLYKPITGGDENAWMKDLMEFDPESGTSKMSVEAFNKKVLCNIVQVPYDAETIKKITGLEKEWLDMNEEEKYSLLSKMKAGLFDKLMSALKKHDEADQEALKNSQG